MNTDTPTPQETGYEEPSLMHYTVRRLQDELHITQTELASARARIAELEGDRCENSCKLRDKTATPLDRPDKPGWWWEWRVDAGEWLAVLVIEQNGQLLYATDDGMLFPTDNGKWLPATPPPVPGEKGVGG